MHIYEQNSFVSISTHLNSFKTVWGCTTLKKHSEHKLCIFTEELPENLK